MIAKQLNDFYEMLIAFSSILLTLCKMSSSILQFVTKKLDFKSNFVIIDTDFVDKELQLL